MLCTASADSAVDLPPASTMLTLRNNMSPLPATAAPSSSVVSDGRASLVTASEVMVNQTLPHPATAPAQPSYQPPQAVNQWSSSSSSGVPNDTTRSSSAVYNASYFAPAHQAAPLAFGPRPQRPLHDIVSSMQGSFHFLQESQIELDSM